MLNAEFVEKISELAEVKQFDVPDVDGRTVSFTSKPIHEVKPSPPPLPALVSVVSLDGFAALIAEKLEDLKPTDWLVQVVDFETVKLIGRKVDAHGRRDYMITAKPVATAKFEFGQFKDTENFLIQLGSLFVPTPDLDYVIGVASGITAGVTRTDQDNGLGQKVQIKRGFELARETLIKNRVHLAPYRTFPECQQPVSEFLFRLKDNGVDAKPTLALFEADGGRWKISAMHAVEKYLEAKSIGIPVVA